MWIMTGLRLRPGCSRSMRCWRRRAGLSLDERDREFEVTGMPSGSGVGLRRLCAVGRRWIAVGGRRGETVVGQPLHDRAAAGQAVRRLSRGR